DCQQRDHGRRGDCPKDQRKLLGLRIERHGSAFSGNGRAILQWDAAAPARGCASAVTVDRGRICYAPGREGGPITAECAAIAALRGMARKTRDERGRVGMESDGE